MCEDRILYRSTPTVALIDHMPRTLQSPAERVVAAARVSSGTVGTEASNAGLLRMLARDRHGSPFEHVVFTWMIETPLFVAREFMRHRIASYNETSGRYREMEPVFYLPGRERPLVQKGKPGAYTFGPGSEEQYETMVDCQKSIAECAWHDYKQQLDAGIAREVARNVLPLSLFTSFYVTMNLRAWTNFTSLRWAHPDAEVPTFPLYEIQQVAEMMEKDVAFLAPSIVENFNANGRRPV